MKFPRVTVNYKAFSSGKSGILDPREAHHVEPTGGGRAFFPERYLASLAYYNHEPRDCAHRFRFNALTLVPWYMR